VTADDVGETIVNLLVHNKMVTGEIVVIDGGFAAST
jgi:3-oxoacyl-[acyl-carrier protein] reductase